MRFTPCLAALALLLFPVTHAAAEEAWQIVLGQPHAGDEAVHVALDDLRDAGAQIGITFEVVSDAAPSLTGNLFVVGDSTRNAHTAQLAPANLGVVDDPEGYAIATVKDGDRRTLVVAGGSIIGDVYGLYWIWDRMQVEKRIPDIQCVRKPAVKMRLGAAWGRYNQGGRDQTQMRLALRNGFNWLSGPAILDLVPWNSEPERENNEKNRQKARELIAYAHALHMKYFSFANAFTFHPSLMKDTGATLNPADPKFWDAVQQEFRMLFTALPELDGIELCNDDISGFWDNYEPFDVTRDAPECEWSYEKRFRTFVNKVHEVVVGEFDKTYFHFTWGLRENEVHCQPDVFRAIFKDIPTKNMVLMPKITRGDRWWFQPYNSTFNLTDHETVVLFETMNYYESGSCHIFPTFSGQYFQRGLQTFLAPQHTNVRGMAALAGRAAEDWGTTSAYSYVLYRLMWNPNEPMEQIARDFCAIHFGPDVAEDMAQIYMLSPAAYQYGLHIEPISYGQFNSFLHMRVGTFPADGYPVVDGGKEHLAFLRKIYLRCDPWRAQTLNSLEQGRAAAQEMISRYVFVKDRMKDPKVAQDIEDRLHMTHNLIRTNIGYVENIFAYFDYIDAPTDEHRAALAGAHERLAAARTDFQATPGYNYDLFGINVLTQIVEAVLADRDKALDRLARTPNRRELETLIAQQQQRYREVLESQRDKAVLFGHFRILIDGQDILNIQGDKFTIKNVRWDGAQVERGEIVAPLPAEVVTVIPRDIESRPMHPFVVEQPSAANGYTVRIYLDDAPGANGWMTFDLYYVPGTPESLGLQMPWAVE